MLSRAVALTCLLVGTAFAADSSRDKLSVKASATEVQLQWFERKPVIVERGTSNSDFQQLGIAQEGEFTDRAIDRRQTYTYRVTPVGELTAAVAVTVGPPPAGYSQAAVNPKQNNANISDLFGQYVCMVLDQNGDPMLAYVWVNPSGNTNLTPPNSDTSIYFVSWNRSTNSFNTPVKVAVTGNIQSGSLYFDFNYPLALARDPVNNTLGIAYRSYSANGNTAYVNIAFSADGGQTWPSQQLVSSPVATNDYCCIDLALYNGAVYEMYYVGSSGPLELATGSETTGASTWSIQHSDQVTGYPDVLGYYSLAADSTGAPAVVITRTNGSGSGAVPTYFWRPVANTIAQVMTDLGFGQGGDGDEDNYAVRLAFYGAQPVIVYNGARNASFSDSQQVWLAYSTTGAAGSWTVTNVPANGGANGDNIGAPFGIAVGSLDQVMVATTRSGGSGAGCGEQSSIDLASTTNFSTWTLCTMGGASSPSVTSLYPTVRYGVNDALFVSFVEPDDGDPLPNGVYVYSQYTNGACSYSLTTTSQTAGAAAGSYSFLLNAGPECSWVDGSNASWLAITSAAAGSGTATITFSATANTSNTARVGTLTAAGATYTVTQSGVGATTAITIQTSPAGLQFSVDGTAYTSTQTLSLSQGTHTIAVTTTQPGAAGSQDVFATWSDGGAASHTITVGSTTATYTATFTIQYLLTTAASPASGGSVTANPASAGGYYNAGTSVQLTASANGGYQFSNWSGGLAGSTNPQAIIMSAAATVTANFSASGTSCSFTLAPPAANLPATGTSTVEPCPNNSGQPSCGVLPEGPQTFTVTPAGTCGAWTATSSNPEFLQITAGPGGSGNGSVSYILLTNTHNSAQNDSITVSNGAASATYSIAEGGNADSEFYRQVYALYEQLLGRDPDSGGFVFWSGAGGASLGQMADSFLTSPETFNSDFAVMAAYQAATSAPPTFAQYNAAVTGIRAGAQSAPGLFGSLIGAGFSMANLYQNLLGRAPTASDSSCTSMTLANCFQTIVGYPSSVTPVGAVNNEFQSTGTYRTVDHTNGLYTQMTYYVTLSRDPDPSGLAFWTGVANSGGPGILFQGSAGYPTRIQILGPGTPSQGFIGSPEFQGLFAN